jgi:hemolysin III
VNPKPVLREPVSGLTHLAAAVLAVVGLVLLLRAGLARGRPHYPLSLGVFGASLVLLYTASSLYHLLRLSPRGTRILRRLDHTMIFVLIAGTYTPVCVLALPGAWGWGLLAGVWTLALAGMVMKLVWLHAPRWLSVAVYLLMGWLVVIAAWPLVESIPPGGLAYLAAGGLLYTAGAAVYALKRPNLLPGFGFHELFHLFVIGGSLSHFWMIYRYVSHLG